MDVAKASVQPWRAIGVVTGNEHAEQEPRCDRSHDGREVATAPFAGGWTRTWLIQLLGAGDLLTARVVARIGAGDRHEPHSAEAVLEAVDRHSHQGAASERRDDSRHGHLPTEERPGERDRDRAEKRRDEDERGKRPQPRSGDAAQADGEGHGRSRAARKQGSGDDRHRQPSAAGEGGGDPARGDEGLDERGGEGPERTMAGPVR
jgi:hypothetical protein